MSKPLLNLPKYESHKIVGATKIKSVLDNGITFLLILDAFDEGGAQISIDFTVDELRNRPPVQEGMYLVQYEDGYISFSPPHVFENGYTPIPTPTFSKKD